MSYRYRHPLFNIVLRGDDVDAFKQWIEQHPDVNVKAVCRENEDGELTVSLLLEIITEWRDDEREKIFEYLVTHHYDIDEIIEPYDNSTILHTVALFKRVRLLEIMMKHGANPNVQNSDGQTPLSRLLDRRKYDATLLDITRRLLAYGAKANMIINETGNTVLFYVLYHSSFSDPDCSFEIVESMINLLIEHGLDISIRNKEGETMIERTYYNRFALKYFLDRNTASLVLNSTQKKLDKILIYYVVRADHEMVESLLTHFEILRQSLFTPNKNGETIHNHLFASAFRTLWAEPGDENRVNKTYRILINVAKNETHKRSTLQ